MKTINFLLKFLFIQAMILFLFSCEKADINESEKMVPKTVVDDSSLPSVYVNGTLLHTEAFGNPNDPMIVCIHDGPGGDYRSMLNLKSFADDGYYVVFYDQRGCGLSQRHDANENVFTLQLFIYDLDAIIQYYQKVENQQVFLIGHSWGAMLATAYVNHFPNKINGLILNEPIGIAQNLKLENVHFKTLYNNESEGSGQGSFKGIIKFSDSHEVYDYELMINGKTNDDINTSERVPYWRYGSVCRSVMVQYLERNDIDITSNLDQYTTKAFICYSEFNTNYREEQASEAASVFQNAEIRMIDDCGHSIPYEGWEDYYPKTMNYLNNITK